MPNTNLQTLANLAIIGDISLADLNVSDVILAGTMWDVLHAQASSNGQIHQYEKETTAPVVGFRPANAPKVGTPGVDELVTIGLKILEATVEADKALAKGYPKKKGGVEGYFAKKGARYLAAAFHTAERQIIYGTGNDADGFVGLAENAGLNGLADAKVVNGTGTGSDLDSAWIIRTGEDDVSAVYNGDEPFDFCDIYEQQIVTYDGAGAVTGSFAGLVSSIVSWLGLQIGSAQSVVRVCNLAATDATGLIEDKIQDGLSLFPSDRMATHIFASRRIKRAVQRGRQKTSTEAKRVGMATDVDGIPLMTSEGLIAETALT